MPNRIAILYACSLLFAGAGRANAQVASSPFPLISGKDAPLTLKLKDLDSTWRVFSASGSSYENLLASAMSGGTATRIFTKGDTVTVGADVFLVTYKPEPPDMAAMFSGGKPTPPKPLTPNSVVRLSLLNLHALTAMDGIRVFDMKEVSAPNPSALQIISQMSSGSGDDAAGLLPEGSAAPDFVVSDDKGSPVKLSAYRGKVVVLDFWSTWCGPCQESLPGTNAIAAKYASKNVVVLGVNVWDTKDAFHRWLPKHKALGSIKFAIDTPQTAERRRVEAVSRDGHTHTVRDRPKGANCESAGRILAGRGRPYEPNQNGACARG